MNHDLITDLFHQFCDKYHKPDTISYFLQKVILLSLLFNIVV